METINGEWIMKGCEENDPSALRSPADALVLIQKIGFLPLFSNAIPGFSVEEHVPAGRWWTGDAQTDPWEWRILLAREDGIAYGKFFNKTAGFISKDFFPIFANYRRNGYDFDALFEDGLAPHRCRKIMDALELDEDAVGKALLTTELKMAAGYGKDGEKNFSGVLTQLQMQTYLIQADFRQKKNRRGTAYGWHLGVVETPETKWGRDFVATGYSEAPSASWERMVRRVKEYFLEASEKDIRTLLGIRYPEEAASPAKEQKKAKAVKRKTIRPQQLPWPENLVTEIGLSEVFPETGTYEELTPDQMDGLAFVLSQFREREQKLLRLRYEQHWKMKDIADSFGLSTGRIDQLRSKLIRMLRHPTRVRYFRYGKQGAVDQENQRTEEIRTETDREQKLAMLREIPLNVCGFSPSVYFDLWRQGVTDLGELALRMDQDPMHLLGNRCKGDRAIFELIERLERYGVNCEKARRDYEFSVKEPPKHIAELPLTVRVYNILSRVGLTQIAEIDRLMQTDPHQILELNGLGAKSREELFRELERIGVDCSAAKTLAEEERY